jgi:hypothetical protein
MKLLISIATYGTKNFKYLNQVIDNYKTFKKYDIDIIVHGTIPLDRTDITFISHENPKNTVFFHRQEFVYNADNYDFFIFSEDDILINEYTLDMYIEFDTKLSINECLGFLRFERIYEDIHTKYLIDMWKVPGHPVSNTNINIGDEKYFSIINPHQSCYILNKDKLKFVINNSNYLIDSDTITTNVLESASSGIFVEWYHGTGVLRKLLPTDPTKFEKCLIEHLPGNHCNIPINSESLPGNSTSYDPLVARSTTYTYDEFLNII